MTLRWCWTNLGQTDISWNHHHHHNNPLRNPNCGAECLDWDPAVSIDVTFTIWITMNLTLNTLIIFSTNIAAVQLCHFTNILSNYNKICFVNSSKIHDSVRRPHWSFVINVTSFQPFSLISILLLRLALNLTSHPIDYVYQMWTPGMDESSENIVQNTVTNTATNAYQFTNTVTLLIMFIKCRRRVWATHQNIATGETSQAITPFHFFDNSNFHH